jgi:hypothetical protein
MEHFGETLVCFGLKSDDDLQFLTTLIDSQNTAHAVIGALPTDFSISLFSLPYSEQTIRDFGNALLKYSRFMPHRGFQNIAVQAISDGTLSRSFIPDAFITSNETDLARVVETTYRKTQSGWLLELLNHITEEGYKLRDHLVNDELFLPPDTTPMSPYKRSLLATTVEDMEIAVQMYFVPKETWRQFSHPRTDLLKALFASPDSVVGPPSNYKIFTAWTEHESYRKNMLAMRAYFEDHEIAEIAENNSDEVFIDVFELQSASRISITMMGMNNNTNNNDSDSSDDDKDEAVSWRIVNANILQTATKKMYVFRGWSTYDSYFDPDWYDLFSQEKFVSFGSMLATTSSPKTAKQFGGDCISVICIPEGARLQSLQAASDHPEEKEFLLPYMSIFHVRSVVKRTETVIVFLEYIGYIDAKNKHEFVYFNSQNRPSGRDRVFMHGPRMS